MRLTQQNTSTVASHVIGFLLAVEILTVASRCTPYQTSYFTGPYTNGVSGIPLDHASEEYGRLPPLLLSDFGTIDSVDQEAIRKALIHGHNTQPGLDILIQSRYPVYVDRTLAEETQREHHFPVTVSMMTEDGVVADIVYTTGGSE